MKLLAQSGHGEGEKISAGISKELIEGVIFSPRDILPKNLIKRIEELHYNKNIEVLFDPQFYVTLMGKYPNLNISKLEEYKKYYFGFESRSKLEIEKNVDAIIKKTIDYQEEIRVDSIISPNILITKSFDSIEGVISRLFIRRSRAYYKKRKKSKKLLCTLAISKEALTNTLELQEFLNTITLLDEPPDGFYLLISFRTIDSIAEIYNGDLLAHWMLLNYSLKINGFDVYNGYSDLFSPFLASVGGNAGCTGWFSNLRHLSAIQRFAPPKREGGSLPIQRYLSIVLLNRIRFDELDVLKNEFPEILNKLTTDKIFLSGDEPDRSQEVLQSWESLNNLLKEVSSDNISNNIKNLGKRINTARNLYDRISSFYQLDPKSSSQHLDALEYGLQKFIKLAEF